ncbi:hypothetical protein [Rhizobium sp. LjRoot258]|uniref:hypothetical protein n=1 Tax=Rhizobium sp. LjRoot258 TaxID=3342299 RepID=UPI003ED011FE
MKLLLKQYLASLNERDELDVVLPDIISEAGFNVISRPKRGTTQYGVDVVATGLNPKTGNKSLFLLSIKSGDLTRNEWASGKQALRPSLEEILEVYIPHHVPQRLKGLPIVIALCFGGDIQEDVRARVHGFMDRNTKEGQIDFDEWNGDRIAEFMVTGLLREKMFPKAIQNSFRKAVAFVDEPSICLTHFTELLRQITATPPKSEIIRLRNARQIYLAAWTIFVWCRDAGNLEAAYRAGALASLWIWDLCREQLGKGPKVKDFGDVVDKAITLSRTIGAAFIEEHVAPYVKVEDGLGLSVPSNASIDTNLALFEFLGRVAVHGLWLVVLKEGTEDKAILAEIDAEIHKAASVLWNMIINNRVLESPLRDDHATDISLATLFLLLSGRSDGLIDWLEGVMQISVFTHRIDGAYPCIFRDYSELAVHPKDVTGYKEEATAGSVLYPTLAFFFAIFDNEKSFNELAKFRSDDMQHCTWQLWVPDEISEEHLYRNTAIHGSAIVHITTSAPEKLIEQVNSEVAAAESFQHLSAIKAGLWPLVLVACQRYRLPIPIHFWTMQVPSDPSV